MGSGISGFGFLVRGGVGEEAGRAAWADLGVGWVGEEEGVRLEGEGSGCVLFFPSAAAAFSYSPPLSRGLTKLCRLLFVS